MHIAYRFCLSVEELPEILSYDSFLMLVEYPSERLADEVMEGGGEGGIRSP